MNSDCRNVDRGRPEVCFYTLEEYSHPNICPRCDYPPQESTLAVGVERILFIWVIHDVGQLSVVG